MVVNGVTDLDEKAQKLLAEHFTGTDFSRVFLLDVDQTSVASPFPPTFGGVVLLSFAGFLLWRNRD